jgi:hypothetical protein
MRPVTGRTVAMLQIHKLIVAERKAAERQRKLDTRFAVFLWTAENRYPVTAAVSKLYRREADAVRARDRMQGNYVVRSVRLDSSLLEAKL